MSRAASIPNAACDFQVLTELAGITTYFLLHKLIIELA